MARHAGVPAARHHPGVHRCAARQARGWPLSAHALQGHAARACGAKSARVRRQRRSTPQRGVRMLAAAAPLRLQPRARRAGGRMVKWLEEITVTEGESDNFYHFHDNRVLPSHVNEVLAKAEGARPARSPPAAASLLGVCLQKKGGEKKPGSPFTERMAAQAGGSGRNTSSTTSTSTPWCRRPRMTRCASSRGARILRRVQECTCFAPCTDH
jgi:hypothetical protein